MADMMFLDIMHRPTAPKLAGASALGKHFVAISLRNR
jgi:hypothetical protein